jgi:hypothetical protein
VIPQIRAYSLVSGEAFLSNLTFQIGGVVFDSYSTELTH